MAWLHGSPESQLSQPQPASSAAALQPGSSDAEGSTDRDETGKQQEGGWRRELPPCVAAPAPSALLSTPPQRAPPSSALARVRGEENTKQFAGGADVKQLKGGADAKQRSVRVSMMQAAWPELVQAFEGAGQAKARGELTVCDLPIFSWYLVHLFRNTKCVLQLLHHLFCSLLLCALPSAANILLRFS